VQVLLRLSQLGFDSVSEVEIVVQHTEFDVAVLGTQLG